MTRKPRSAGSPARLPKLPKLLDRKIYKTGQTRGADDDEIYQNRVSRSSTALIPYPVWKAHFTVKKATPLFKCGFLVLISPNVYFSFQSPDLSLANEGLRLGENALVFYETRTQWLAHPPTALNWIPANSRLPPCGGQYVARISAITSNEDGEKIIQGFETTANKGAGIRVYEYANDVTIEECRWQLEALFWFCHDSLSVATANGMTVADAELRKAAKISDCRSKGLLDYPRLQNARIIDSSHETICPLCLSKLSSQGFFSRLVQAEGREVLDLTVTQLNLFHIEELRMGIFNHVPYNLGWGHHHCNVVVKDSGIMETLKWMHEVVQRNIDSGLLILPNSKN